MSSLNIWNQKGPEGFQLRIEALTSGILSPDSKAITLLSMEPGVRYTATSLYNQVKNFAGLDELPLTAPSIWPYCNGSGHSEGSLSSIGAVVKVQVKVVMTATGPKAVYAYEKTGAGSAFGDSAATLGIAFVNKLVELEKPAPWSLLRIFGASNKSEDASFRRGFLVYKIIELLANNPDIEFNSSDIMRQTGLTFSNAISPTLFLLGKSGMIDYVSPYRESGGEHGSWALFKAESTLNYKTCLKDIREQYPEIYVPGALRKIVDYINEHIGIDIDCHSFSNVLGINKSHVSSILSYLRNTGHLTSQFEGKVHSAVKANDFTGLLWVDLLEPIGRASRTMNPEVEGFRDKLLMYKSDPQLLVEHIGTAFEIYADERNNIGPGSGQKVKASLLEILRSENHPVKLSNLVEKLNEQREAAGQSPLIPSSLNKYLVLFRKEHAIEQTKPGWYGIKQQK